MKFVLLVEGNTEKQTVAEFLKRWLDPQLTTRVGIQVVRFNGYSQLLQKVVDRAQEFIDGPKNEDIVSVIGLIDLYGPTFYPEHCVTAEERRAWATQRIENDSIEIGSVCSLRSMNSKHGCSLNLVSFQGKFEKFYRPKPTSQRLSTSMPPLRNC